MSRLTIIIPCFNEERTIAAVLGRIAAMPDFGWEREIIVIDDGSVDGTAPIVRRICDAHPGWTFLSHERNVGKGAAVRTGLDRATGDAVLVQDADEEYDPADIPALVTALRDGVAVYGSRIKRSNPRSSLLYYLGGRALSAVTNLLYGLRLTDMPTGYKLAARRDLERMDLRARRFEFCAEVTAKLSRLGVPIIEVPISYAPRSREEGKKIRVVDGFDAIVTLSRYRFWHPVKGPGVSRHDGSGA